MRRVRLCHAVGAAASTMTGVPHARRDTARPSRSSTASIFGEGPRWHDGRLWYSDFYARGGLLGRPERRTVARARRARASPRASAGSPTAACSWSRCSSERILRLEPDGTLVHARRPQPVGHLPRQRHGGGRRRAGLRRQLRVRPRGPRRRGRGARCASTSLVSGSTPTARRTRRRRTWPSPTARSSSPTAAPWSWPSPWEGA